MPVLWIVILALGALVALVALGLLGRWLLDSPRGEDLETGLVWRTIQLYARFVHRLRVEGAEHVPARETLAEWASSDRPGLILVANHTAGVDPLLVQAALRFEVRWMMARDMQFGPLAPLWSWARVISVDRGGTDRRSAMEGIRHLREGGVLGVFPEGGIERPPRALLPFHAGVGFFAAKAGARVLPVLIDGTPYASTAYAALLRPSRSRLRFLPIVDYRASDLMPGVSADDLRRRFAEATGWPLNDEPDVGAIRA